MFQRFIEDWELYANAYLSGLCIAALLAVLGVIVVARNQIFIGAAVSQASVLGLAASMTLISAFGSTDHPWLESQTFGAVMSAAMSIAAALLINWRAGSGRETQEAVTGFVFLVSASISVLLAVTSGHSQEQAERLLSASLLVATRTDVYVFGGFLGIILIATALTRRRLLLLVMDPTTAAAQGMHTRTYNLILAVALGLALGLAQRVAGMLFCFGCLVLPAMVARHILRRTGPLFFIAPIFATIVTLAGFIIAHHYDFPPSHAAIAGLSLLIVPAWMVGALRNT